MIDEINCNNVSKKEKEDNDVNFVCGIFIKVINDKKEKIFEKNIIVDKNQNYILHLDKLYIDITSELNILNIDCKY